MIWYFVTMFALLCFALGHQHDPTEWRLFLDPSKVSLKGVFLHNGNRFPSVPITHAANIQSPVKNRN